MEKIPYSKYTKELRQEAVRLVTEGGLSVGEASMRLSLPKSTLENWLRAFKAGKLERIGANHRPLTDVEMELSRVKRELALVRMERDILKKAAVYSTDQRNTLTDNNLERWCVWHKWDDLGSRLPRRQIFGIDGNTVSH
jgi:transposase